MKLDQIAFYSPSEPYDQAIKRSYGLTDPDLWSTDVVTGNVSLPLLGIQNVESKALLQFTEALGMQFEIIRWLEGPHWQQNNFYYPYAPFIAHVGFHLDPHEEWPEHFGVVRENNANRLVQEMITTNHTNPKVPIFRRYHYRIYDTRDINGMYSKYIRRLNVGVNISPVGIT